METSPTSILVVDENNKAALELKEMLHREAYESVAIANTCDEALASAITAGIHIVLIRIYKGGERDCIATIRKIHGKRHVPVIYITEAPQKRLLTHVRKANAAAVIVQPYLPEQMIIAIEAALQSLRMNGDSGNETPQNEVSSADENNPLLADAIFVRENNKFWKISVAEVLYMQSDNNITYVVTKERKFIVRRSLQEVIDRIEHTHLARVHRSYVVNVRHVTSFDDAHIFVEKKNVPLSKKYRAGFMERIIVM